MATKLLVVTVIDLGLALIMGWMALCDAGRAPAHRRPVRMFQMCVACYYTVVWLMSISNVALSRLYTRVGMGFVLIYMIVELWSYRHAHRVD